MRGVGGVALFLVVGVVCGFLAQFFVHQMLPAKESITTQQQPAAATSQPRHVLVIGGGLAGLSAAIEAARAGARVTLLEKEKNTGGNSAKASSGMNAVVEGHGDSVELFTQDTLVSGGELSQRDLVHELVTRSAAALSFLRAFGLDLSVASQCGGHSAPRTFRLPEGPEGKPNPVGWGIVSTLRKYIDASLPQVSIIVRAKVERLLVSDGKVCGVSYSVLGDAAAAAARELRADAVVLCTGGFSANRTMLSQYAPAIAHLPTTNGQWAQGDGVQLAAAAGATLTDMEQVQVHPTGFVDPKDPQASTKFLAAESLRAVGGILLNQDGQRFVNELTTRDAVTARINAKCFPLAGSYPDAAKASRVAVLAMDQAAVLEQGRGAVGFYASKGLLRSVPLSSLPTLLTESYPLSASEPAQRISQDQRTQREQQLAHTIQHTLTTYAQHAANNTADEFGKTRFPSVFRDYAATAATGQNSKAAADSAAVVPPLTVGFITPVVHYTMGGVVMNEHAQLCRKGASGHRVPIAGLYGAGEVTAGVHGRNRLAGNSLLECVVFGRIAGVQAANYAQAVSAAATASP